MKQLLFALCAAALLSGCLSMPLSTIARMSTFNERSFAALDANDLRVRVTLPEGFELAQQASRFVVTVTSGKGIRESEFALQRESIEPWTIPGGVIAADSPASRTTLRLSGESVAAFRDLQVFVSQGAVDDIDLNVNVTLSSAPPGAQNTRVWIELKLARTEDYMTLVDGEAIALDRKLSLTRGS